MNITHTNICIGGPLHGQRYREVNPKQDWFEIVEKLKAEEDIENIENKDVSPAFKPIKYNRYVFISEENTYNHFTFWVIAGTSPEKFKNQLLSLFLERRVV